MIVSILIIGIASSYGSSTFVTLFKEFLQPQTKPVDSETLKQIQTPTKTTMTIVPKKIIMNSTVQDISSSKSVYVKPQSVDGGSLYSKNSILTPVSQPISASSYQGQFTSTSSNPSQSGSVGGYYVLFNAPEGTTYGGIQSAVDSQASGYYSVYSPASLITTGFVSPPISSTIGGSFISRSTETRQVLDIETGTIPEAQQIFVIPSDKSATIRFDIVTSNGPVTDVAIKKLNTSTKTFDDFLPTTNLSQINSKTWELKITGLQNEQRYILKIKPKNSDGYGVQSNEIIVTPTSNAAIFSQNNIQLITPPALTSTELAKLASKGFTDTVMPPPITIPAAKINPFAKDVFKEKIIFTQAISKTESSADVFKDFPVSAYTPPATWDSNTVFSIPPAIIPLENSGKQIGQKSIYRVTTIEPEKPVFMSFNDATPIDSVKGKLAGVQYSLGVGVTATNVNVTSAFLAEPPAGTPPVSGTLMYLEFKISSAENIDFSDTSKFSDTPKVSFSLGPQANSVSSTNPIKNQVNNSITCPQPEVYYIDNSGNTSTLGITVTRNPDGDDATSCGYTATIQHFSSYGVSSRSNSGGGGSGGSGSTGSSGSSASSGSSGSSGGGGGGGGGKVFINPLDKSDKTKLRSSPQKIDVEKVAADKAKKIQLAKEITKKLKQGNQKTTKTDLTKAAVKEKMKLVKSSGTNKKVVSKNIK